MENFVILDNLIPEIVSFENLSSSFDYVVRDLKEKQRKRFEAKKDDVIAFLRKHIEDGSFQVTNFETLHVKDGPKEREVQAPPVIDRIGCHAIMNVFEDHVYPTVIETPLQASREEVCTTSITSWRKTYMSAREICITISATFIISMIPSTRN